MLTEGTASVMLALKIAGVAVAFILAIISITLLIKTKKNIWLLGTVILFATAIALTAAFFGSEIKTGITSKKHNVEPSLTVSGADAIYSVNEMINYATEKYFQKPSESSGGQYISELDYSWTEKTGYYCSFTVINHTISNTYIKRFEINNGKALLEYKEIELVNPVLNSIPTVTDVGNDIKQFKQADLINQLFGETVADLSVTLTDISKYNQSTLDGLRLVTVTDGTITDMEWSNIPDSVMLCWKITSGKSTVIVIVPETAE